MSELGSKKIIARRIKFLLYWNSVALLGLVTVLKVLLYDEKDLYLYLRFGSMFVVALGILAWLYWDGKETNVELTMGFCLFAVIMGPIMLPTYYLRTKELKKAMKLVLGLALYLPYYCVHYVVWNTAVSILD